MIRRWLIGGLAIAVLDGLDAIIFFGLRGVPPIRVFQGIASGLLGKSAFQGGASAGLLGLGCHLLIAFTVAGIYLAASRRIRTLAERPLVWGPLYGLAVYAVMNAVVIPLSLMTTRPKPVPVLVNGLLIHLVGVGLPAALAAWDRKRKARGSLAS